MIDIRAGRVEIDGIDVASLSVDDLRSRITIIPQDPTFIDKTSLRFNLDPLDTASDLEIEAALHKVKMLEHVERNGGLHGINVWTTFSHGEQQLLAFAKAILEKRRIVVLDEAMSR